MGADGNHDASTGRHLDARALRFAVVFPVLLSLGLVAGGLMVGGQLAGGAELPWGGGPVPLAVFLATGVAAILLLGAGIGSLGARTTLPRTSRRVLLGVAMALQLAACTLFAAALLGQTGQGELPAVRVDGYVMLMGSGLAAAMGVVLALTFKPDEQWSPADDAALAALVETAEDPAAARDRMGYFLHPRSSVIVMILLAAVLPGSLLALLSPWILPALVLAALVVVALLCATVQVDRTQLTVKLLGFIPALVAPCEGIDVAVSLDVAARDHGGWGLRRHSGSATFLAKSGAAVVIRQNNGGSVVVGAPDLDAADELAAILNRRAGKSPGHR